MPYAFLLNLLQNKWTWIVLLFLTMGGLIYYYHSENVQLKLEKQILVQNDAALRDSVQKKADSIQVMTVAISGLNDDKKQLKKEYDALHSKYVIAIASSHDSGKTIPVVDTNSATIKFSGSRGITTFEGFTVYYPATRVGAWDLKLSYAPITADAILFYDKSDSLWKVRTISLTPGIDLISYTKLDQQLFKKLGGNSPITEIHKNVFGLGFVGTTSKLAGGLIYNYKSTQVGIHYDIINNYRKSDLWYDKFELGVHYFIF